MWGTQRILILGIKRQKLQSWFLSQPSLTPEMEEALCIWEMQMRKGMYVMDGRGQIVTQQYK